MMLPTARAARGRPASAATSPYVATRPGGIRRTMDSTRAVNALVIDPTSLQQRQRIDSQLGRVERRHDRGRQALVLATFPEVDVVGILQPRPGAIEDHADL